MIVRDTNTNPTHIRIDTLDIDGRTLVADPPLELEVVEEPDPNGDLCWIVDDMDWSLAEANQTVGELELDVRSELRTSWREYAEADDDELSPAAIGLKRRLRERFKEQA